MGEAIEVGEGRERERERKRKRGRKVSEAGRGLQVA